jgi:hypothetical protein
MVEWICMIREELLDRPHCLAQATRFLGARKHLKCGALSWLHDMSLILRRHGRYRYLRITIEERRLLRAPYKEESLHLLVSASSMCRL